MLNDITTLLLIKNQVTTGFNIMDFLIVFTIFVFMQRIPIDVQFNRLKQSFYKLFHRNKSEIILEAFELKSLSYLSDKKVYSLSILGLIHYMEKKKINIRKWKQTENRVKYDDKPNDFNNNNSIYTPFTTDIIKLTSDIYCKFVNRTKDMTESKKSKFFEMTNLTINIYSNIQSIDYLKTFIKKCEEDYKNFIKYEIEHNLKYFSYFSDKKSGSRFDDDYDDQGFKEYSFNSSKSFDNIFFDKKKMLLDRIIYFLNNKEEYNRMGVPYTLGLLFHGKPGCGKTSTIKAIANHTKRHIINVEFNKIKSPEELLDIFYNPRVNNYIIPIDKRIYVIEEVDTISTFMSRKLNKKQPQIKKKKDESDIKILSELIGGKENEKQKDGINLSHILNLFDGLIEQPGRIVIFTTNYPEKIDDALTRPGRIDLNIEFTKCSINMIKDIIQMVYKIDGFYTKLNPELDHKYTPAEIFQKCFRNSSVDDLLLDLNQ